MKDQPLGSVHDYDFLAGEWNVRNRRLRVRGVGSDEWEEFPATSRAQLFMGGVVNVDEIEFPTKGWSGMTVRTFDLAANRWSIYWVNSRVGRLFPARSFPDSTWPPRPPIDCTVSCVRPDIRSARTGPSPR